MPNYPPGWPGVPLTPAAQRQKEYHERLHGQKRRPRCWFCKIEAERERIAGLLERGRLQRG